MNYEYPLVSIGLPVYNSEKTLDRALNSILSQDYPNFEVIISDNSSRDRTTDICKEYAKSDNRIKLNINKINLGGRANFQIVFKNAAGKYFMWAADDDFWEPEFIRTLVSELEPDPMAGVALCAIRREYADGKLKDIIRYDYKHNLNNISNLAIAANLLSPKRHIKNRKFNLFIYGIFRSEAINGALTSANNILHFGERAFLSGIALAYKFRYIDKVLYIKTLHRIPYRERNPDDTDFQAMTRITYWQYYYHLMVCISKSSKIPWKSKLFVLAIPYYIAYRFVYRRKKKLKKKLKKFFLEFSNKWFLK